MKLCDTCIYRNNVEQLKPCIIYRDDCEHYERDGDMNEVGFEIVKTEEVKEKGVKYLNINVSNSEVERNPDIVRLCADVGILEYVKPKMGYWIDMTSGYAFNDKCSECGYIVHIQFINEYKYCPNCGARMESEDKE